MNVIDEFLASSEDEDEAAALWDILAAIRGPDTESSGPAKNFTIAIRAVALPRFLEATKTSNKPVRGSIYHMEPSMFGAIHVGALMANANHFADHVDRAMTALGMDEIVKKIRDGGLSATSCSFGKLSVSTQALGRGETAATVYVDATRAPRKRQKASGKVRGTTASRKGLKRS